MAGAGTVTVDFAAETAKFTAELKQVNARLKDMETGFGGMAVAAKTAFSLISVGVLTNFAKQAWNAADAVGDMASRLGVSVESLSRLRYAADQNDVSFESLSVGIKNLQKNLAETDPVFSKLGLSAKALKELSLEQQFASLAEAFRNVQNPADQTRIAMQLFGKAGVDLVPLLNQGADGIAELTSRADELGLTLNGKTAEAIDLADKKLKELRATLETYSTNGLANVIIGTQTAAENLARLFHGSDTAEGRLTDQMDALLSQRSTLLQRIATDEKSLENSGATAGRVLQTYIAANKRDLATIEQQLNVVNGQLLQIDKDANQLAKNATPPSSQSTEKAGSTFKESVNPQTTAEFAKNSTWLNDYVAGLDNAKRLTQTAAEKMLEQWDKFDDAIVLQMNAGALTAAQAVIQQKEYVDQILQEQAVSAKKVDVPDPISAGLAQDLAELERLYGGHTGNVTKSFRDMYAEIDRLQAQGLISETKAAQSKEKLGAVEKDARLQSAHELFSGLASLQNAGSKRAFEIGKAGAIANATLYLYEGISAAMKESNWYVGLARAAAVSASVYSQISSIKSTQYQGYMSGGYTGDGANDEVAGVVHRGEYVMDAATTARLGTSNLDAMRRGQGGSSTSLVIENHGTPQRYERTQGLTVDEIRYIARDEVHSQAPGVVATELSNPNSRISKSISRNTQAARRR